MIQTLRQVPISNTSLWLVYYKDKDNNTLDLQLSASSLDAALMIAKRVLKKRNIEFTQIVELREYKIVNRYVPNENITLPLTNEFVKGSKVRVVNKTTTPIESDLIGTEGVIVELYDTVALVKLKGLKQAYGINLNEIELVF